MVNGPKNSSLISASVSTTDVSLFKFDALISSNGFVGCSNSPIVFGSADSLGKDAVQEESPTTAVSSTVAVGQEEVKRNKYNGVFSKDWPEEDSLAFCKPTLTKYVVKTSDGKRLFQAGVSALVGTPKCGKSTFLYSMIADLTRGGGTFGANEPSKVLIVENEDPRGDLMGSVLVQGGVLARVNFFRAEVDSVGKSEKIKVFLKQLEEKVAANPECRLVLVDSLGKLAPSLGFTMSTNSQIRLFVDGLQSIGEKFGVAVLVINHFNKGRGKKSLENHMAGSSQFFASIRALWVAGYHPTDENLRCVSYYKGNISKPCAGLVYGRVDVSKEKVLELAHENGVYDTEDLLNSDDLFRVELVDESIVPPEVLVNTPKPSKGAVRKEEDSESDEAEETTSFISYKMKKKSRNTKAKLQAKAFVKWLLETLSQKGEMLANEAEAEATNRGLKPGIYRKARKMAEAQGVLARSKKVNGVKASCLFMENMEVASLVAETGVDSNPNSDCGFSETIDKSFVFSSMT
jgi:hypothetical protein